MFAIFVVVVVAAGAMRLPGTPESTDKSHYLPDYYASTLFQLPLAPFKNSDENAFYKFYNKERVPIKGKITAVYELSFRTSSWYV